LYRKTDGQVAALNSYCSHRRAPLSKGRRVGDLIECPYHGLRFASDGRCVLIPSQSDIPDRANIRSYAVLERYGLVWVWVGEESANPDKLPHLPWRESSEWDPDILYHYHVKAAHILTTDNLLDLGHVAFIHSNTVGFEPSALKEDPLKTEIDGDRVRNTRIIPDTIPGPNVANWGRFKGKIERTSISTWYPPCYTSILFRSSDETASIDLHIDHFITPETDRTHNYFVVVSRNFGHGDPEVRAMIYADADRVHHEDIAIIEAQQEMIDAVPGYQDMPIRQDRGLVHAHRIMKRLHAQQTSGKSAPSDHRENVAAPV
jgi:vanillate monooxygenase